VAIDDPESRLEGAGSQVVLKSKIATPAGAEGLVRVS